MVVTAEPHMVCRYVKAESFFSRSVKEAHGRHPGKDNVIYYQMALQGKAGALFMVMHLWMA